MKKSLKFFTMSLFILPFLSSCVSAPEAPESLATETEFVGVGSITPKPEKIKGKLDVYAAMTRAAKYNISESNKEDIGYIRQYVSANQEEANKIVNDIRLLGGKGRHVMYDDLRVLDFATLLSYNVLLEGNEATEIAVYKHSGRNLMLSAILKHNSVIYAHKKNKAIGKSINTENKKIANINAKFEKQGKLSEEDLVEKKNLEVLIHKLDSVRENMLLDVAEYSSLIKAEENDKISVEGKMFYELEDFDNSFKLDVFQKLAVRNRVEFDAIRSFNRVSSFEEIDNMIGKNFPDLVMVKDREYGFAGEAYVRLLQKRAGVFSENLLKLSRSYHRQDKIGKTKLRKEFMNKISEAVFLQVEIAYNLVHINHRAVLEVSEDLIKKKKDLKALQKNKKSTYAEISEKALDIEKTEYVISRLKADRAFSIRALYFYAGFDVFKNDLLGDSDANITRKLRIEFNKNMIETLANIEKSNIGALPGGDSAVVGEAGNIWAKEDRWIDNLVEDGAKKDDMGNLPPSPAQEKYNKYLKTLESPVSNYEEHYSQDQNDRKIMQLGAYSDIENANNMWGKVYNAYPEARFLLPEVETVVVNGKELHRLLVKSEAGGFVYLCNKIRSDGLACILK